MNISELKKKYPLLNWITGEYPVGVGYTPPYYKTYGLLIPPKSFPHKKLSIEPKLPIFIGNNGNAGNFNDDSKLEEDIYKFLIKPHLLKYDCETIFMHIGSEGCCEFLQKNKDIDILGEAKQKNISISIKSVRSYFENIFWECIKNSETGVEGWGIYTCAQKIWYCMPIDIDKDYANNYQVLVFDNKDILKLLRGD